MRWSASERERLTELLAECYDDPDLFNSAILGRGDFWRGQVDIGRSVVDYRQTICYTGNMVGKDYAVGSIVPWWLYTRSDSLVIVTGPSQTTLGTITWKEIRRACDDSKTPLGAAVSLGTKNSPQVCAVDARAGWQALGYSTTNVERASGQHNAKLLVIVEEASGVEDEIWEAIDSLGYDRLLAIGNPIRADGEFVRRIHRAEADIRDRVPRHKAVNAIQIASTQCPNADKDKCPLGLADKTWIDDNVRHYGKDSLWVRSHVRAEIPIVSAEVLIPLGWLDFATSVQRQSVALNHPIHKSRRIACDLGEGVGRDSTSIVVRDDWGVLDIVFGSALGLSEAAMMMFQLGIKWDVPQERMSYDRVGIGRDFPKHLAKHGITKALGYAGAGSPISTDFPNLRSEAAWRLRDRLNPDVSGDTSRPHAARPFFSIPPKDYWPRLREELKVLTYSLKGRQTALLKKEDHAELLGHSPDLADAIIQSFAFA